jgi:hypothetical protein
MRLFSELVLFIIGINQTNRSTNYKGITDLLIWLRLLLYPLEHLGEVYWNTGDKAQWYVNIKESSAALGLRNKMNC